MTAEHKVEGQTVPYEQQKMEINRFQFMELIVRMSDNKYRKSGTKEKVPYDEAIEMMIDGIK